MTLNSECVCAHASLCYLPEHDLTSEKAPLGKQLALIWLDLGPSRLRWGPETDHLNAKS